jgi:hypothetical protein
MNKLKTSCIMFAWSDWSNVVVKANCTVDTIDEQGCLATKQFAWVFSDVWRLLLLIATIDDVVIL